MTDSQWLSLIFFVTGMLMILLEGFLVRLNLLVLGITACLLGLACLVWEIPVWGLVVISIVGIFTHIILARRYPRNAERRY